MSLGRFGETLINLCSMKDRYCSQVMKPELHSNIHKQKNEIPLIDIPLHILLELTTLSQIELAALKCTFFLLSQ